MRFPGHFFFSKQQTVRSSQTWLQLVKSFFGSLKSVTARFVWLTLWVLGQLHQPKAFISLPVRHKVSSRGKTDSVYIQTYLSVSSTNVVSFNKYIGSDICYQSYVMISWSPTPKKHSFEGEKLKISMKIPYSLYLAPQALSKLKMSFPFLPCS